MIKKTVAAFTLSCLLLGATRAQADYAINGFTPASVGVISNYTFGYSFTLSQTVYVSGLSIYDANGSSPLKDSHQVGIWQGSNTTALATATVDPSSTVFSTPGPNSQSFAGTSLASALVLQPGTYFIGAYYAQNSPDAVVATTLTAAFSPLVGYQFASYHFGSFGDPTTLNISPQGYIGPNFSFSLQPATVPEPSGMILIGIGASGLLIAKAARRKLIQSKV